MHEYLDVWLKFDSDEDEIPTLEANTRMTVTGYAIDWYHIGVGLVTSLEFDTLADAYDWYESNNFSDYAA